MSIFDVLITSPIGALLQTCFNFVPNKVTAIVLFAIVVRIILFPFSLLSHKQSIKMVLIKPQIDIIKARYGEDYKVFSKKIKNLYKKEKYSSFMAALPLLLQIPIIIAVIRSLDKISVLADLPANLIIPMLSAISAFAMCYVQTKANPISREQSFWSNWSVGVLLTIFSGYFAYVSAIGFGIYWIAGNVLAIIVQVLCNLIMPPPEYKAVIVKPSKEQKRLEKAKEKIDLKRFYSTKKELIFYSEKSGFFKYFQGLIEYLLNNSDIEIHYITSDYNDQVHDIDNPKFRSYYIGSSALISLFMKIDSDIVVMTMPDLHRYQYKRSIVKKDVEYIYLDHGFGSLTMVVRKNAFDHFDTVFCYGKNHNEEIRAMEKLYCSKEKTLVNTGFGLFDKLLKNYTPKTNEHSTILVAPSWQEDNIFESCLDDLLEELLKTDYKIILRPHPEFVKRFQVQMQLIIEKYGNRVEIQTDFSDNEAIQHSDVLITDWSTIAVEFSFITKKPSIFINTPMKVINQEWEQVGIVPLEISLRDKLGVQLSIDEVKSINNVIKELLANSTNNKDYIEKLEEELMYDNSQADRIGGDYIIQAIERKRLTDEKDD